MVIDNCPVCDPIQSLVEYMLSNGYQIVEKRVDDYHFRQVFIKLMGSSEIPLIKFRNLTAKNQRYFCSCHWSTVETIERE